MVLAKAFPELSTPRLAAMQRQQGPPKSKAKKPSMTVHGPSRRQVLLTVTPPQGDIDFHSLLRGIQTTLSLRRSTLVAQSISMAYDGYSIATDRVASSEELSFVREAGRVAFPEADSVGAALPSSTSYLTQLGLACVSHGNTGLGNVFCDFDVCFLEKHIM
jgi:hypothetical protein